ncbi:radical SAM protein, partial [Escherichia coli]|nr:radical SAM protein [Escherichia coli]
MERVKLDLSFFAAHKPKHIDFLDGTFNLSPKRTIELLNYLIEINESTGCTFHAEIKPELLTSEEIKLMKKANFTSVELGLQSIHTSTLKAIKRRNVWEKLEKSVENLLNEGIDVIVNT